MSETLQGHRTIIENKKENRRQSVVAGRQQLYCAVQSRSPSHCQTTTEKYSLQLAMERRQRWYIPDRRQQAVPRTCRIHWEGTVTWVLNVWWTVPQWTERALYQLLVILWRLLVANFTSVTNLFCKCSQYWCFWIVHLPVAKQRMFNCNIQTVSFSCHQLISELFDENHTSLCFTVAKLRSFTLCAFSAAPCISHNAVQICFCR